MVKGACVSTLLVYLFRKEKMLVIINDILKISYNRDISKLIWLINMLLIVIWLSIKIQLLKNYSTCCKHFDKSLKKNFSKPFLFAKGKKKDLILTHCDKKSSYARPLSLNFPILPSSMLCYSGTISSSALFIIYIYIYIYSYI